jgi:hypothetical protein
MTGPCTPGGFPTRRGSPVGQLVPLTLFTERGALEIIEGFKRVQGRGVVPDEVVHPDAGGCARGP